MKKLVNLGIGDVIWSVLPIVFWLLVRVLWGNEYSNGFIIGYSFQFIVAALSGVFIKGSLKSWVSCGRSRNYFGAGLLCYLLISLGLCLGLSLFGEVILPLFNYKDNITQGLYVVYAWQFSVDGVVIGVHSYLQYSDRIRLSQLLSYLWCGIRLVSLVVVWVFCRLDCLFALKVNMLFLLILCGFLVLYFIDFRNMKLDIRNWFTREGYSISSRLIMFVIYLLGVGSMSSNVAFLSAYSIMSQCTDIQWDLHGSIDTYVAVEAADGLWSNKKKRILITVLRYSIVLFFCSLLLVLLNRSSLVLIIFCIEMSLYIPDCMGCYWLGYVSVKNPSKWLWVLGLGDKLIRLCVQVMIGSVWGIPISCAVGIILYVVGSYVLYRRTLSLDNRISVI